MVLKIFHIMQSALTKNKSILILLSLLFVFSFTYNPTDKDWYKIAKSTKQIFEIENCNFIKLTLENKNNKENYFKISSEEETVGYLVTGNANSKYREFDFYILYSINAIIMKVEILTYRETHGFEICNKKWLQQFIGLGTANEIEYNNKIDGISGATISVSNMKHEIFILSNILKQNMNQ